MGYWWFGLSSFVHIQVCMALAALLCPLPTSSQWRRILNSGYFRFIGWYLSYVYLTFGVASFIAFIDSMREYFKYKAAEYQLFDDAVIRKDAHVALLQAQRNYYISGIAFLSCLLVPKLYGIVKENGKLDLQVSKAVSATKVFKELLRVMELDTDSGEDSGDDIHGRRPGRSLIQAMRNEFESALAEHSRFNSTRPVTMSELTDLLKHYEELRNKREAERLQAESRKQARRPLSRFSATAPPPSPPPPPPPDNPFGRRVGPWPRDRFAMY